jgi:phytoene synthase
MVSSEKVEKSKKIQKKTGTTFYLATRILPKNIRYETYILYAFFREADEIVDTTEADPNQGDRLEKFRRGAKGNKEVENEVIQAFNEVREIKDIKNEDVDAFIDSMKMDIQKNEYGTFEELQEYMDGSAAAVGRMMTCIMDPDQKEKAMPHATALGEAYQMTNFLRDIGEDIDDYNRIYLPKETRDEFNVTRDQIQKGRVDKNFKKAVEKELKRTEYLYEEGVKGIKYLPDKVQFPVFLSSILYSEHHRLIRKYDYDVLNQTPDLSKITELKLLPKAYYHWKVAGTPLEAFRRTSTIYTGEYSSIDIEDNVKRSPRNASSK